MMKCTWAVAMIFFAGCGRALPAAAPSGVANHVPAVVQTARMVGPVPATQPLQLNIVLPGQDPEGLAAYLQDLYNPQSPLFHAFLTPDAYHVRFDPTDEQVAAARGALTALGIEVEDAVHDTYLVAHTNAALAEKTWRTSLARYESLDGNQFIAPSINVTMPEGLVANAVVGLYQMPPNRRAAAVQVQPETPFGAAALRKALQFPATATGAGLVVGVYAVGGYNAADMPRYLADNNLSETVDVKNILLGGETGAEISGFASEADLDTQSLVALVPNANIRVYEVPNESAVLENMTVFSEMASPTQGDKLLPRVIDVSYGLGEAGFSQADINSIEPILQRMAAQGQTVYACTGDNAYDAMYVTPVQVGVAYPASSPWVVGVGATFLAVDGSGTYAGETTWYDGAATPSGSGGGVSVFFPMPSWQSPLFTSASKGSSTMRNVPDVAANGDPNSGVGIEVDQVAYQYGGTSLATPEWVAFHAAVDQARAAAGLEPLGFALPALYYVANTPEYTTRFHDIADGSTNGKFPAVTGLDNCTGLGSFTPALFQTLSTGYSQHGFTGAGWLTPTGAP